MQTAIAMMVWMLVATGQFQFVTFDEEADFAAIKSFSVRQGELKGLGGEFNRHEIVSFEEVIRSGLSAKGLKETSDRPDIVVTYGVVVSTSGKDSYAVLTLDINRSVARKIWNGYLETGPRLSPELPDVLREAVKTLLAKYPPRK
ncbi:MAG TPA: DUF4136 domain-containing protein [Terriglobia bacterium]|nr:DUF4136 domain-containing protein [Terriglobia bacterium]